jgi:hypothetical protein
MSNSIVLPILADIPWLVFCPSNMEWIRHNLYKGYQAICSETSETNRWSLRQSGGTG